MIAPNSNNGQSDGDRKKLESHAILESHRHIYVNRGRRVLLQTLLFCGRATADDVRELVELPPGIDPKLFGSVPGPLARAGIIRQAGFAKTCRPQAHARPVSVWALANRQAAEDWLRANPDEPDADCLQSQPDDPNPVSPGQQELPFNQIENPAAATTGSN